MHTAQHGEVVGRANQRTTGIAHMDTANHIAGTRQTVGNGILATVAQQGDTGDIAPPPRLATGHGRFEQTDIVGTLYTQVGDGTVLHMGEEILILHVQVRERMTTTLEVATEWVLPFLTDTGQLPVVEVEVFCQIYLIAVAEVGIIKVHGTCDIVLDDMGLLSGNGGIEMGIEHIAHCFSLFHRNLLGITVLVGLVLQNPPIGLEAVRILDGVVLLIKTYLAALQSTHLLGGGAVDKMDKRTELRLVLDAERGQEDATVKSGLGSFAISIGPPGEVEVFLFLRLILPSQCPKVLFRPGEIVDRRDGQFVVVIANVEQIAIASLQRQAIGKCGLITILDITQGEDVVVALAARRAIGVVSVAIVHVVEPHLETGAGRQHR